MNFQKSIHYTKRKKKKQKVNLPLPNYRGNQNTLNHVSFSNSLALNDPILIQFQKNIVNTRGNSSKAFQLPLKFQ